MAELMVAAHHHPHTPFAGIFDALTRPFYRVFRRFIPPMGGFDLAPLFARFVDSMQHRDAVPVRKLV